MNKIRDQIKTAAALTLAQTEEKSLPHFNIPYDPDARPVTSRTRANTQANCESEGKAMKDYVKQALRTESLDEGTRERLTNIHTMRMLHAAMGIATESGELMDAVKKYVFYGKISDRTNLIEELGDLLWYIAIATDALDTTIEDIMRINIEKLKVRYPEKFTRDLATNRDLDAERRVLEGK